MVWWWYYTIDTHISASGRLSSGPGSGKSLTTVNHSCNYSIFSRQSLPRPRNLNSLPITKQLRASADWAWSAFDGVQYQNNGNQGAGLQYQQFKDLDLNLTAIPSSSTVTIHWLTALAMAHRDESDLRSSGNLKYMVFRQRRYWITLDSASFLLWCGDNRCVRRKFRKSAIWILNAVIRIPHVWSRVWMYQWNNFFCDIWINSRPCWYCQKHYSVLLRLQLEPQDSSPACSSN